MSEVVWVADWEMQCCGEPFEVGQTVEWHLTMSTDNEWLAEMFGTPSGAGVTSYYDHHSEDGQAPRVRGVVRSIRTVRCTYRQSGRTLVPVSGSATTCRQASATGWEAESEAEGIRFVGYLVELDAAV